MEIVRVDGEPVSLRLNGHEFACEEFGQTTVPKAFLTGFRLSDIPDDVTIKPVEFIDEHHTIHIEHDIELSRFSEGSANALVEQMFRRKFWDGEVGLSPYVAALRQAVDEHAQATESDFQDDGDNVFLRYAITVTEDLEIQEAASQIEALIANVQERTDQLVGRHRDRLLDIFDRGSFDADFAYALRGSTDGVVVVMLDIDHFKRVNDTYGHQVGDAVLPAVARVLVIGCLCDSEPYRYGGEEFAVILARTTKAEAMDFAESIRAEVETIPFEHQPELRVTVSVGVAATPGDGSNAVKLLQNADSALYRAKREGRNRVR